MKKSFSWILGLGLLLGGCSNGLGGSVSCPKVEEFQKKLDTLQPGIQIEKIEKSPVQGLCKVIIKLSEFNKAVFYTDNKGNYIITGNIIDIAQKKDIVREEMEKINKRVLDKNTLSEIEKLTDFTYGNSPNVVYFITDPDCPVCKRAEPMLENLVKEGKITVKTILLPLESLHSEAKNKSIALICDKKGFQELMQGYKGSNLCASGKEKIEKNIDFMFNKLGITGTPTFIFPDGEVVVGLIGPDFILNKFKLK
ncbi:DsbC family protein [Thermodesulfobacterium sp. TA1]|uniref:DsbC family protein n=1 Tax=Thermodesulfobacterium sp. TA1 TaxID=2234087 RepID=UPI001232514C|nr:DsbC family protein [Thermodesulfobacterium sp. TA1]QER41445.1 DsbC family protein [Thermodesulfobacterium sp. TA1]